ncbi:hypothetical protein BSIN_2047 [Burkholderia singularis]|uniref:Uncharacterized protein n=1 Tax=Burkholderia singularis TaxID=1503053 RepID=A0A238H0I7_9BURK|nr:hypothetical protein BSIN_2047 [Burkholderia singularis]
MRYALSVVLARPRGFVYRCSRSHFRHGAHSTCLFRHH